MKWGYIVLLMSVGWGGGCQVSLSVCLSVGRPSGFRSLSWELLFWNVYRILLAHLSTKCSWWAIVVNGCPLSVVVCRPSSCVVRRRSTFDVYTLETTFVIRFLWNLVRMFVLTISRPSSNMGHVRSKTSSPGQILRNSCLHSTGHIATQFLWNFVRMFVLTVSMPSSNILLKMC